jgi:PAS domain S-box-containing protein
VAKTPYKPPPGWVLAGGDMARRVREFDWSTSPLGPRERWSASLKLASQMVLSSGFPMALRWGPEYVLIYNDAYIHILGDKHPAALGQPAGETWSEVWADLRPIHDAIMSRRLPSIFTEDQRLKIQRRGDAWEEVHLNLGYSPVLDSDAPGGVGGVLSVVVEITERVAAEAALRASEERYAQALAVGIGSWDWDIRRAVVVGNDRFAEMYGVPEASSEAGAPLAAFGARTHPADRERVASEYQASMQTREPFSSEYRLIQPDGAVRWVFARGRCYYDETGTPIRVAGVSLDVTDRFVAQEELARSEAEFRAFAQAAPNHVWSSLPDGNVTWFNDRCYEYTGVAPGLLDGELWAGFVHPDDAASTARNWSTALATGNIYENEFRLRRADGSYRWHLGRAVPVRNKAGEIVRWVGTNTDIEDQKLAARALTDLNANLERRVAEQAAERDRLWKTSQDLLVVVDEQGIYRAVNPAWGGLLGWSEASLIGRHHSELVHPEDRPRSGDSLARAQTTGLRAYENRMLHQDGGFRWISWVAAPEDGMVYATGRDITAEKEAAIELAAAQEALRQSQKMEAVGQLTGGIAHDFNNMLAVVIGSLELLARRLSPDDARALRYVDAATDAARRAALLTQRLLAFSRQQPLQPAPIEVNKLVASMSDLLRHSIGADIRLETILAGGLWRTYADPNQLENVVLNLAINARDAMPGGGRLTIETQNADLDDRYVAAHPGLTAGHYVLIAITDTGSGMPPEVIERAFDPFFTTKAVGKGTGLGLSQVYGFVKQTGGHVKIYSEVGQGTTIKIYLPRLRSGTKADEAEGDAPRRALLLGDDREVILVVEDEPAVRQISVDALEELGYRVLEADGAQPALESLRSHPEIVLLFTDVVMPDVNGARLADEARQIRPDLKILFTTGYTRNAVVHNGVLDDGVDLISKPFTIEQLSAKLRAVIDAL